MKLTQILCTVALVAGTVLSAGAQSIYVKPFTTYLLATNLATIGKGTTNTATPLNTVTTNTYLSALVPLPLDRDLVIIPQFVSAGALAGTSNFLIGFEYSDGLTFTTSTDPLMITFSLAGTNTVVPWLRIAKTNFYGATYLIPDYVGNAGNTNGTLSIGYSFLYP